MWATSIPAPIRDHRRVLTASLVGTTVEYYDFFIYATAAALVFGPLFFPGHSPGAQTLFALSSVALASIARPIGAVCFGHFGDRVGRKKTLVVSMLLMGGCTFAVAFLPTYAAVGWIAPALLCLIRFVQGFAVGGEWAGAALLSVENAPDEWKARFGVTPPLGASIGKAAGYGLFLILGLALSKSDMAAWGWRLPFLVSALLVIYGMRVRLKLGETAEFRAAAEHEPPVQVPIARLFRDHFVIVLAGSLAVMAANTIQILSDVFALAQAETLGYRDEDFLAIQLIVWPLAVVALLVGATWADWTASERSISFGLSATIPVGLCFGAGLGSGSLLLAGAAIGAAKCAGVFTMAAMARWLCQLFPVRVRYSGVAVALAIGTTIGQGATPVLAQWGVMAAGLPYVGLLPAMLGLVALFAVRLASRQQDVAPAVAATPACG